MSPESNHWFVDHQNIVTLVHYMADRGDSAREVARAVTTPWKFEAEFRTAQAILNETAVPA